MESHSTPRSVAHDEALSSLREVDALEQRLSDLYRLHPGDARRIGQAHRLIGSAMKRAEIHASLAIAEELAALRADLNDDPADRQTPAGVLVPGRWQDS